jgi:small neutral amino acid transporter SnatA (MarC family)
MNFLTIDAFLTIFIGMGPIKVLLGILLAALAVQLVLNGLADVGVVTLTGGH